jgi:hypothetical protein
LLDAAIVRVEAERAAIIVDGRVEVVVAFRDSGGEIGARQRVDGDRSVIAGRGAGGAAPAPAGAATASRPATINRPVKSRILSLPVGRTSSLLARSAAPNGTSMAFLRNSTVN